MRKNRIVTIISMFLLTSFVIFLGGCNSGNTNSITPHSKSVVKNSTGTAPAQPPKPPTPSTPPELHTEGDASNVHIKVLGMETMNIIEDKYNSEKPKGVFKVVNLNIKNNQRKKITVDSDSFKLLDDQKRVFAHSTSGGPAFQRLNLFQNHVFFLDSLDPRHTIEGYVVFDVPTDAKGFVLQASGGYTGRKILLKVE